MFLVSSQSEPIFHQSPWLLYGSNLMWQQSLILKPILIKETHSYIEMWIIQSYWIILAGSHSYCALAYKLG